MRVLAVGLALVVAACSSGTPSTTDDAARRDALVAAAESAAPGSPVDLRATLGTDWERAVFLGPYADNEGASEALGFDFDLERVSPWTSTDAEEQGGGPARPWWVAARVGQRARAALAVVERIR